MVVLLLIYLLLFYKLGKTHREYRLQSTEVYRLQCIKTERKRRACGNLSFQQVLSTAEIKQ